MRKPTCTIISLIINLAMTLWGADCFGQRVNEGWRTDSHQVSKPVETKAPAPAPVISSVPNGCVISSDEGSGGSGIMIESDNQDHCFVLTCAHLFTDRGLRYGRKATCHFPNGQSFKGELIGWDKSGNGRDAAIIALIDARKQTNLKGAPFAQVAPEVGDTVYYWGWAGKDIPRDNGRDGVQWHPPQDRVGRIVDVDSDTLMITGGSIPGMSGGPILNAQGEVIASLWGVDDQGYCIANRQETCLRLLRPVAKLGRALVGDLRPGLPFGAQPGSQPGRI